MKCEDKWITMCKVWLVVRYLCKYTQNTRNKKYAIVNRLRTQIASV